MYRLLFMVLVLFVLPGKVFSQETSVPAANFGYGIKGNFILSRFPAGTPEEGLGGQGSPTSIELELTDRPTAGSGFNAFVDYYFPAGFSYHAEMGISFVNQYVSYLKHVSGAEPKDMEAD